MVRVLALWLALCAGAFAQAPTGQEWINALRVVHQSSTFNGLTARVDVASSDVMAGSPMRVLAATKAGEDCLILVADMPGYYWDYLVAKMGTADFKEALMLAAAAHEFGHCLEMKKNPQIFQLNALVANESVSAELKDAAFKRISRNEAIADAYGLAYLKIEKPALYEKGLNAMMKLRTHPQLATPKYQVMGLYKGLEATEATASSVEALVSLWMDHSGL